MFFEGQAVRAKKTLIDDLTEHGMGQIVCADIGEKLIIRKAFASGTSFAVSHEDIHDKTFIATVDELELIPT